MEVTLPNSSFSILLKFRELEELGYNVPRPEVGRAWTRELTSLDIHYATLLNFPLSEMKLLCTILCIALKDFIWRNIFQNIKMNSFKP